MRQLPYLNQMENNNRPISTGVVLGLAREYAKRRGIGAMFPDLESRGLGI